MFERLIRMAASASKRGFAGVGTGLERVKPRRPGWESRQRKWATTRLSRLAALTLMAVVVGVLGVASPAHASRGDAFIVADASTPSTYGQTIELVGSVQDSSTSCHLFKDCETPTGRVDFYDIRNPSAPVLLGSANLVEYVEDKASSARITYCCLDAGSFPIQARYVPGGPDAFDPDSHDFPITVRQAVPGVTLTQSSPTTDQGQPVTFTTTVTGVTAPGALAPTGEVQFYDGHTALGGPVPLVNGSASITVSNLSPGSHTEIQSVYRGDINYESRASSQLTHTVVALDPTTTSLTSAPNPSGPGQPVTFTATVTSPGGTPTGTVAFRTGETTLGTANLNGGVATFTTSSLAVGSHSITAAYGGQGTFLSSRSAALTQTVLACTISASPSSGPTMGTAGNDVICGSAGADDVFGGGGDDVIVGGGGDDRLSGGDGHDTISGGDGNDRITGDAGNDRLDGEAGTDTVVGGDGTDTCIAEAKSCEA
ncbi:MAG: Ig-like domain repeat protein [Actinomycetota bacterium]|nr:Ig-like domain repeat protein [Actinomycetota bacterium]